MSHGLGVTAALRSLPDLVVVFFALVTQLGDVWFYLTTLTVAYAFADALPRVGDAMNRERVGFVIAVALGVIALTTGLKELFAHPRPPGAETARQLAWLPSALVPVWENISTADGYSLPSGHATGSAAIYGAAAVAFEIGRRRDRYVVAALVVLSIAASRVIIGVHYLGDVVAGVVAGTAFLALVKLLDPDLNVERAFSLTVMVALIGTFIHFGFETASALGGALGGRVAWGVVGDRLPDSTTMFRGAIATLFGLVIGGSFVAASTAVETPAVGFVANALAIAAILAGPVIVDRLC